MHIYQGLIRLLHVGSQAYQYNKQNKWVTTHLVKKLYNLTVQMACTVQVHNFYWLHDYASVYSVNENFHLELCKPYEQLNCIVFFTK